MSPIRISIVSMGSLKHPVDMAYLERWPSKIVALSHGASIAHISNAEGDDWQYTDEQISRDLKPTTTADITLGLINAPLEGNYYMRRLGNSVAVLSLYEMADIVRYEDYTVETFVLRTAYELAVLYAANRQLVLPNGENWTHDDVRGCLFDMCSSKSDIVFSLHRPMLCIACRNRVLHNQVDRAFLPALDKELSRIQKSLYVRMSDWVKQHPVSALVLTAISAVALDFVANVIFEKVRRVWPWVG